MSDSKFTLESTFLDRFIGYFSPEAGLHRMRARAGLALARRTFEGASKGRRTKNWNAHNSSVNALIAGGLHTLRARSRYLCRNTGYGTKAVTTWAGHLIGDGIIPQVRDASRPDLAKKLNDLWTAWGDETLCDVGGRHDFYGLQAIGAKTIVESGSFLIRRYWRRKKDGLPVPFQIQLLEPDHLDTQMDRILDDGGRIIQGVEYDKAGRRVAYHLFSEHPGDRLQLVTGFTPERVPADDIIHVFRTDRIGQADGVPWSAPAIIKIKDLDEYEDAELIRQKISACFVGSIEDIEAGGDDAATKAEDEMLSKMEPGVLMRMPPGKRMVFGTPPAAPNYEPHTRQQLRHVAAAYGLTYEDLTGDYSQVNFSSARMAALVRDKIKRQGQNHMFIPLMCKGVWRWFAEAAVVSGAVDDMRPAIWTPPAREMIDPVKETDALKTQVRSGFKSLSEAIRENGRDPESVFDEIEADAQILDKKKITVDADPRRDVPAQPAAGDAGAP